jgi:hypothetical protein
MPTSRYLSMFAECIGGYALFMNDNLAIMQEERIPFPSTNL